MYEEVEERRSRLVPILTIVAGVLAGALGISVVLFLTGVFDRKAATPVGPAAAVPAPAEITAAPSGDSDARAITPPSGETTDVPKAIVSVAPPAQGDLPVRSTHGDWQVRCDTPA